MAVQSSGLISGIDSKTLIQQLMSIERIPIQKLETKKAGQETQISKLGKVTAALKTLEAKLKALDTMDEVVALKATSSNTDSFTATAAKGAKPASYSVQVTDIAREEKDRSVAFSGATGLAREGTLTFKVKGGADQVVTIAATDTIEDVVAKIRTEVTGVNASLISDGTSSYISLTAAASGFTLGGVADDALVITESYTGGGGTAFGFTQTQQATNAKATIDGLPVESEKNELTNFVDGVTISIKKVSAEVDTLTIDADVDAITTKVKEFVDAYNAAYDLIKAETTVSKLTDRGASLAGDPTLRALQQALASTLTSEVASLSGSFKALSSIGVKTDTTTGKLALDATKLKLSIAEDLGGVAGIFAATDGVATRMYNAVHGYTQLDGILAARTEGINKSIKAIDKDIDSMEERILKLQDSLTRQFTALETALSGIQSQSNFLASALG